MNNNQLTATSKPKRLHVRHIHPLLTYNSSRRGNGDRDGCSNGFRDSSRVDGFEGVEQVIFAQRNIIRLDNVGHCVRNLGCQSSTQQGGKELHGSFFCSCQISGLMCVANRIERLRSSIGIKLFLTQLKQKQRRGLERGLPFRKAFSIQSSG